MELPKIRSPDFVYLLLSTSMGFKYALSGSVALWTGNPDCQAGHDHVRNWLRQNVANYPAVWKERDYATQGNLGEVISYCVGEFGQLHGNHIFEANAFAPFSRISRNEIDLLWIGFGQDPADDFAIIQEVKTTFDKDLGYAKQLVKDYEKAFGTDPAVQFNTHLGAVKLKLEKGHKRPDLAIRVSALAAMTPATAKQVRCIPTLVHDLAGNDPVGALSTVRATLLSRGWTSVQPWSIGLSDIESRLPRIIEDKS